MATSALRWVATAVGALALATGSLLVERGAVPVTDLVFATFLFSLLLLALQSGLRSLRAAVRIRRRAERAALAEVDDVARPVLVAERARMATDVGEVVRRSLVDIRALALAARTSTEHAVPREIGEIQALGRRAVSELRRMIGWLRTPAVAERSRPVPVVAGARLHRGDVVLAVGTVVLCVVESLLGRDEIAAFGVEVTPLSVLVSAVAAAAVVGWRAGATLAATTQAVAIAIGVVVGAPVLTGGWMILGLGFTAWGSVARCRRGPLGVVAFPALVSATLTSQWIYFRENTAILAIVFAAGAVTGVVAALGDARRSRAALSLAARQSELARGATAVVHQDRLARARDLHDAVSGSIGVAVLQAGAAELLWETQRARAVAALDVAATSATSALDELDELVVRLGAPAGPRAGQASGPDDLVGRMRAAGLSIDVDAWQHDGLPHEALTTVYRVVQEALVNAARHAPASHVVVSVRRLGDEVHVVVTDDGPGATAEVGSGFGLVGLTERVTAGGGSLLTTSGSGGGFSVTAQIPVRSAPIPLEVTP